MPEGLISSQQLTAYTSEIKYETHSTLSSYFENCIYNWDQCDGNLSYVVTEYI